MTAADLLAQLDALGVRLTGDDGRLRVNAARGQLTEELKAKIAALKPQLLALLAERASDTSADPTRVSRTDRRHLSFFQERLWVIQRFEPDSTAYNLVATWPSPGPADPQRVADALGDIVRRHEILRTIFPDERGGPTACLLEPTSVPIEVHEIPIANAGGILDAAVQAGLRKPFDLTTQPPVRFGVYRIGGAHVVALLAAHHIAVDAWSMRLLGEEIVAAYELDYTPPPPAVQYADYAAWERRTRDARFHKAAIDWWKQQLAGLPPLSTLPPDLPRAERASGATRDLEFGRELSDGIRALARRQGATVYMALLAACAAVLQFHTGQDDLAIGSPMGARERPELETVIGPFVDLLVLRLDLSEDPCFAELVRRVRDVVLDAHGHRQIPFEALIEHVKPVRSLDHAPLCQVAVVQHNATGAGGPATPLRSGGAIFDLMWVFRDEDGVLRGGLEYRSDRYSATAIERVAARLEAVLATGVADPRLPLSRMDLLTAGERAQVREHFNATWRETDPAPFAAQFERQVATTPDAVAVGFEGASLTYSDLNRRANQIVRYLASRGVRPGDVVGLHMRRSLELVAALVGIHKAGAAYLPLDPDFPAERLGYMLADCGVQALVADGPPPAPVVPAGAAVIDLAAARDEISGLADGNPPAAAGPSDLAYIIYTSGSTGRPNGVRIRHAALSNFLASMRHKPGLTRADVLVAVTTLSFDIAGLELYLPLTVGARIELVAKATASNGAALAGALSAAGATIVQATPATWRLLVEAGWPGSPGFRALCGGEALPRDLADALLERVSELWNLYGPTETTIWSTAHRVPPSGPVFIGKPIANTRVYVLNRRGQLLPPGISGEIYIAGAGVADGYHGRPDLTEQRFVPDRFGAEPGATMYRTGDLGRWTADGVMEHLGRTDHQVQIRGFRIELGEIEAVLAAHPAVKQAVLMARSAGLGDVRLVAYVVYEAHQDLTVSEVRRHLRTKLPDYMIPSLVVTLDAISLTPNGKVDRATLPDPFATATRRTGEYVPPAPGAEQIIAEIWREILQIDRVGAGDNFFELGGHSLLSLRVAARVEKALGWRMDPRVLFFQTLRQVAAAREQAIDSADGK